MAVSGASWGQQRMERGLTDRIVCQVLQGQRGTSFFTDSGRDQTRLRRDLVKDLPSSLILSYLLLSFSKDIFSHRWTLIPALLSVLGMQQSAGSKHCGDRKVEQRIVTESVL